MTSKIIIYRPLTNIGVQKMQERFEGGGLNVKAHEEDSHDMAKTIMETLQDKTEEYFTINSRKISSDNQPSFSEKLAILERKK